MVKFGKKRTTIDNANSANNNFTSTPQNNNRGKRIDNPIPSKNNRQ